MPEAAAAADAAPQNLTPAQGEAALEKLLGSVAQPDDEDKAQAPEQDKPEAPSQQPEDAPEQPSEEPDQAPEEADEDNAEVEGAQLSFMVPINGQDVPVTVIGPKEAVQELRDNGMRRADYTQKTQALSQERQAFEEHAAAVIQERQFYANFLGAFEERVRSLYPQEPNWQQLLAHPDKSYYWTARAQWDETVRQLNAAEAEKERLTELQQQDFTLKLGEQLGQARTWLTEQLPEWRDEKRASSDKGKLREYAKQIGFSDYDVDHAYDPRIVLMGYYSMKYQELMANKPRPTPSNGPSPLRPGVAVTDSATVQTKLTKAKRRLAQTGHPKDAEAAIELILQRGH